MVAGQRSVPFGSGKTHFVEDSNIFFKKLRMDGEIEIRLSHKGIFQHTLINCGKFKARWLR